jgi:hypothetical protein
MISAINNNFSKNNPIFGNGDRVKESVYDKDTLLKNNLSNRARIGLDKFAKAFTVYPARGLKGSKNSNFYEFLTMGTVPYFVGSATLMGIFNASKRFSHYDKFKASQLGNKVALGVLFYGLFKSLSKSLINVPVKLKTGIDTELPYAKVNYLLQDSPDDYNLTSVEYHKVGESVDFTRWDLLYGDKKKGEALNARYDKIAKKNGLGTNLNDSDQEVKPLYKEVLVKSKVAKSFSSFLWAGVGVALAFQDSWLKYFKVATPKFWHGKEFLHSMKVFGTSFVDSAKELYNGGKGATGFLEKHSGKAMLGLAVLSTIVGVVNACHITNKPSKTSSDKVIDKNKACVEG